MLLKASLLSLLTLLTHVHAIIDKLGCCFVSTRLIANNSGYTKSCCAIKGVSWDGRTNFVSPINRHLYRHSLSAFQIKGVIANLSGFSAKSQDSITLQTVAQLEILELGIRLVQRG